MRAGGAPVAIVSRRLADRLWPGQDAVGKRLRQARPENPWITVVGVAGDVRDSGTWAETWYLPYEQHAGTLSGATVHLMVRSHGGRRRGHRARCAQRRRRSIRCCRCPSRR